MLFLEFGPYTVISTICFYSFFIVFYGDLIRVYQMFLGVIMCNSYVTNVLSYCNHNTFVLGISFFFFVFTSLH